MCALPSAMGEVRSGERGARGKPEPEGIRPRSDPDRFPSSPASKLPQLGDIRQTWNILVFFFSSGERSNVCEDGGNRVQGSFSSFSKFIFFLPSCTPRPSLFRLPPPAYYLFSFSASFGLECEVGEIGRIHVPPVEHLAHASGEQCAAREACA